MSVPDTGALVNDCVPDSTLSGEEISAQYQFVKLDDLYFCLQQSPPGWFRLCLSQGTILRRPPFSLDRLLMLRVLKRLLLYRWTRLQNADILQVHTFGQLCIPVRRGFKVFDLQRKIVTKLFSSSSDHTTFMAEFDQVRRASALGLAPGIRNWNIQERWYEEEFISGCPAYSPYITFDSFNQLYQPQIVIYLERMILADPAHRVTIGDYLNEMVATLERDLFSQRLGTENLRSIRCFAETLEKQLQQISNHDIRLVFSHGDFSRNNLIITPKGVVPLDWEHAFRRTPLHDLYWYFLLELSNGHMTPEMAATLINNTVLLLHHRLNPSVPDLAKTLVSKAEPYRLLFYLEMLARCSKDEQVDDGQILAHHARVFTHYEAKLRK